MWWFKWVLGLNVNWLCNLNMNVIIWMVDYNKQLFNYLNTRHLLHRRINSNKWLWNKLMSISIQAQTFMHRRIKSKRWICNKNRYVFGRGVLLLLGTSIKFPVAEHEMIDWCWGPRINKLLLLPRKCWNSGRVRLLYLLVLKSDAMCRHTYSWFEFEFEARIMNVLCVVPNPDNYEFELNTCPNKTIFECAKTVGYFSALYSTTRYDFLKFDALIF